MSYLRISEELQYALSDQGDGEFDPIRMDESSITLAMARQLNVARHWRWEDDVSLRIMRDVVEGLDDLLRTGAPKNRKDWANRLLVESMKDLNREELYGVFRSFGWEDLTIKGEPRITDLAKVLKRMAVLELERSLTALLDRWVSEGVFDRSVQRRRRRSADLAQDRRDQALRPSFTPPGKT